MPRTRDEARRLAEKAVAEIREPRPAFANYDPELMVRWLAARYMHDGPVRLVSSCCRKRLGMAQLTGYAPQLVAVTPGGFEADQQGYRSRQMPAESTLDPTMGPTRVTLVCPRCGRQIVARSDRLGDLWMRRVEHGYDPRSLVIGD